jgi:type IV secretory pathway VirB10-like protein
MTEPRRLRDDDDLLLGGGRDLLRAARPSRPMTRGERGRGASRVAKLVSAPLAGSAVMLWMKLVAAAAGLGVVGVVAVRIATPLPEPATEPAAPQVAVASPPRRNVTAPPRTPPSPSASTSASPDEVPAPIPTSPAIPAMPAPVQAQAQPPAPAPQAPARAQVRSAAPAAAPEAVPAASAVVEGDDLTREAALVEAARGALAHDPAEALLRIDEHARAFPHGQLGGEREIIAVDALRRLGRNAEARARGEALLRRDPTGLYGERVRSILAKLP